MQSNKLKGARLLATTVPTSRQLELTNEVLKFSIYERLQVPNPAFALPGETTGHDANQGCPLVSRSGKTCDTVLNDRHLGHCKVCFSGPIQVHDNMVAAFWLPQAREIGLAAVAEQQGLVTHCITDKRPADISWIQNGRITLKGVDVGYTDPISHNQPLKSGNASQSARISGIAVEIMEETKIKNLKNLTINSTIASDIIAPCCFEITGGAGKHAEAVISALAMVAHPGSDKCPQTIKLRTVWKTHFYRLHTFALIRARYSVAERKHYMIARALHGKLGRNIPAHGVRTAAQAHEAGAQSRGSRYMLI